jgi:hypothetical protein
MPEKRENTGERQAKSEIKDTQVAQKKPPRHKGLRRL